MAVIGQYGLNQKLRLQIQLTAWEFDRAVNTATAHCRGKLSSILLRHRLDLCPSRAMFRAISCQYIYRLAARYFRVYPRTSRHAEIHRVENGRCRAV
jgi:hypothetical protein